MLPYKVSLIQSVMDRADRLLPWLVEERIENENFTIPEGWLEAILRRYYSLTSRFDDVEVMDYSIEDGCYQRESYVNDIVAIDLLAVLNDLERNLHFTVKFLPTEPILRKEVIQSELDRREIMFYTKIVPDLQEFQKSRIEDPDLHIKLPVPECFLGKYRPPKGDSDEPFEPTEASVLILENLKYQNFTNASYHKELNVRQMRGVFDSLAKIHALTLSMKALTEVPLEVRYEFLLTPQQTAGVFRESVAKGFPILIDHLKTIKKMRGAVRRIEDLAKNLDEMFEALLMPAEPISTLTHTDFSLQNLIFKGPECVILDWQMISCSRPTNDIALFLATSVTPRMRRRCTRKFITFYWISLARYCSRLGLDIERDLNYNKARLVEDYKRSQLLTLLMFSSSIRVVLQNRDAESRLVEYVKDLKRDNVFDLCVKSPPR